MIEVGYQQKAFEHLTKLTQVQPNRRTGSQGNQDAVDYFTSHVQAFGFEVDVTPFPTLDYVAGACLLSSGDRSFDIFISPYSRGCDLSAELVCVDSIEELEKVDCKDKILLMSGDICAEQLMPKNFVFYNPEHHQRIYHLLEEKGPAGIVTATARNPSLVGALYPFPLIYDGDFNIPVAFCTDDLGDDIQKEEGKLLYLMIESTRIPALASNVVARKNPDSGLKVILTAHIDAYEDSPGAADNGSGTVVLMLLAEMLGDYFGDLGIEIVAINGEDHYSAGGEMNYLGRYGDQLNQVVLAVNIDDVGFHKGNTGYSLYGCSSEHERLVVKSFHAFPGLIPGEPWYNGDHMIFVQKNVPCLALTAELVQELMQTITHTSQDTPAILVPSKLVEIARALFKLVDVINNEQNNKQSI